MKITKDLTEGNIWRNFVLYTIPLFGSVLLSSLYSTVDSMIAGQFIDEYALGAINATSSFEMIIQSLVNGFSAGFSVYIALLFGQKNYARLKNDILQILVFFSTVIIAISAISILLRNPIMEYLNVDPILRENAEIYFTIYTAGSIIVYINIILVQILNALGVTTISFFASLFSAVLHIGGNLLTIFVFHMGVAGLAYSTLVSAVLSTVIHFVILRRIFRELPCEKIPFHFSFSCVGRSLHYTLPASVQQLAYHGVGFLIAPTINGLGADATTGYTVATRINSICANSFYSGSGALGCHTSQSVGAGKLKNIRKGLWVDFWICTVLLMPFVLIGTVFAEPVNAMFFPAGYTGTAFQYAVRFSAFYLPFLFINMPGHLLHTYLRGLGVMNVVLGVSLLGSAVRFAFTLVLTPQIGMEGIYLAWILGWIADAVVSFVLYIFRYRTDKHLLRTIAGTTKDKQPA